MVEYIKYKNKTFVLPKQEITSVKEKMSNKINLKGLLGGDPELKYTNEGLAIATFNVADTPSKFNQETKKWENVGETVWYRVSAFGNLAESAAADLKKGDQVYVIGTLNFRQWEDKDKNTRESKEVKADEVYKPLRRNKSANSGATSSAPATASDNEESPF